MAEKYLGCDWLSLAEAISRLRAMRSQSVALLAETGKSSEPVTLSLLRLMNDHDIAEIAETHALKLSRLEHISTLMDRSLPIIQTAASAFIVPDLVDYTPRCQMYIESYQGETSPLDVELFGMGITPFVFHGLIQEWDWTHLSICSPLLEDGSLYRCTAGNLILQGYRYDTTVSLLDAAKQGEWPSWQSFWKWF